MCLRQRQRKSGSGVESDRNPYAHSERRHVWALMLEHREMQWLPVYAVFFLMESSKEESQQALCARLQPDSLGFTCSDSGSHSRILEPNWIQSEPPVTSN